MQIYLKNTFLLLFLSCIIAITYARAQDLPVVTDFTIDAKDSQARQVPILVLFMSKSCHFCEIVLRDFLIPMQSDHQYDNKVILRQIETSSSAMLIDFNGTTTSHKAFSSKHKMFGVPTVMLFNGEGQVLTSIEGLLTVDYYLAYLENAINESQAKIKASAK